MKKKTIKTVSIIFSFLLLISVVYASVNNTLKLKGYATLNGNVALEIIDAGILNARTGESIVYAQGHLTTRDRLVANLYLSKPSDERVIEFYIRNTGSAAAVLGVWSYEAPQEIIANFTALSGTVIPPAATMGPYYINISWSANYPNISSGNRNFIAKISYHI